MGRENPLVSFRRIFLGHDTYEFSFSGMKSQVSFLLERLKKQNISLDDSLICDIAYEFQEAVVEVLSKKLVWAGEAFAAKTLGLAGGVSANQRLQEAIRQLLTKKKSVVPFLIPEKKVYSTDNGAMIGAAALITKKEKVK